MYRRGFKSKNTIVILASVFLISFILMTINIKTGGGTRLFDSIFTWVVSPAQRLSTRTANAVSGVFRHYFFLTGVTADNERLRQEVALLRRVNNDLVEQVRQQARLGKLLGIEGAAGKPLAAAVVGRDATQWSQTIFIDKGARQGIRENLAVMTDGGVIGHVIEAMGNAAKVLLLTDSRSAVDTLFQESRISGVVVGTGQAVCDMKYVPIAAKVEVGDKILTSGLGGIFPKGLVVGTVAAVKKKKEGLFQEISVAPAAEMSRLEEVLVLIP